MHCYLEFVCGEKISQKLFDCEGIKITEQQNKYAPSKISIPSLDTEILVDHGGNKFLRRHTMISSPLYFFCSALCNTKEGKMFLFSILDLASQLIPCQSAILEDSRDWIELAPGNATSELYMLSSGKGEATRPVQFIVNGSHRIPLYRFPTPLSLTKYKWQLILDLENDLNRRAKVHILCIYAVPERPQFDTHQQQARDEKLK